MFLIEMEIASYMSLSFATGLVFRFPTEKETEGFELDLVLVSITVLVLTSHTVIN